MKKLLSAIVLFFLAVALGTAGDEAIVMESMTPAVSKAFTRSGKISELTRSINEFMKTSLTAEQKTEFMKDLNEFKARTGIDPLNDHSLKEAGIDTAKPLGFAYIDKSDKGDKTMLFLPVFEGKAAMQRLVQIVKSMKKDEPSVDVYPVITPYRSNSIFQLQPDLFCTAIDDYLIIASQDELLRQAMDLGINSDSSLAADPLYIDYLRKIKNGNDLNMFARKELLAEAIASFQKAFQPQQRNEMMEQPPQGNRMPAPEIDTDRYRAIPVMYPADGGSDVSGAPSPMNSLDYLVLGLNLEPRRVHVQIAANMNESDPMVSSMLALLKTGGAGEGLFPGATTVIYGFLGFDLKKLDEMCRQPGPMCAQYEKLKSSTRDEFGIDLARDFIPFSSGTVNMFVGNPTIGEYTLFLPMTDRKRIQSMNTTMQAHLKKKYGAGSRFGLVTMGTAKGCWFFDKNNKKQFLVADDRGVYMSSSEEFLKSILKERTVRQTKSGSELMKKLGGNIFFLAYVRKNMFLMGLLQSQAQGSKQLRDATGSIGDVYLTGSRSGNFISIDLDMAMEMAAGR